MESEAAQIFKIRKYHAVKSCKLGTIFWSNRIALNGFEGCSVRPYARGGYAQPASIGSAVGPIKRRNNLFYKQNFTLTIDFQPLMVERQGSRISGKPAGGREKRSMTFSEVF
jgi:hypothetical protein